MHALPLPTATGHCPGALVSAPQQRLRGLSFPGHALARPHFPAPGPVWRRAVAQAGWRCSARGPFPGHSKLCVRSQVRRLMGVEVKEMESLALVDLLIVGEFNSDKLLELHFIPGHDTLCVEIQGLRPGAHQATHPRCPHPVCPPLWSFLPHPHPPELSLRDVSWEQSREEVFWPCPAAVGPGGKVSSGLCGRSSQPNCTVLW